MSAPQPLMNGLRLYQVDINPYGHRVLLILEAKRVNYEVYRLDPLNLPQWFKNKNPDLKIPVLEIPTDRGDRFLFETVVICDYLDEKYIRNPLHSRDPYRKAQDRLFLEKFNGLIKGALECYNSNLTSGGKQIMKTLEIFQNELVDRGSYYFGGYMPGMLDYMIWPWVERLYLFRYINGRRFEEKLSLFPDLADWADRMKLDPVVKKHSRLALEYYIYYKDAHPFSGGHFL